MPALATAGINVPKATNKAMMTLEEVKISKCMILG